MIRIRKKALPQILDTFRKKIIYKFKTLLENFHGLACQRRNLDQIGDVQDIKDSAPSKKTKHLDWCPIQTGQPWDIPDKPLFHQRNSEES